MREENSWKTMNDWQFYNQLCLILKSLLFPLHRTNMFSKFIREIFLNIYSYMLKLGFDHQVWGITHFMHKFGIRHFGWNHENFPFCFSLSIFLFWVSGGSFIYTAVWSCKEGFSLDFYKPHSYNIEDISIFFIFSAHIRMVKESFRKGSNTSATGQLCPEGNTGWQVCVTDCYHMDGKNRSQIRELLERHWAETIVTGLILLKKRSQQSIILPALKYVCIHTVFKEISASKLLWIISHRTICYEHRMVNRTDIPLKISSSLFSRQYLNEVYNSHTV